MSPNSRLDPRFLAGLSSFTFSPDQTSGCSLPSLIVRGSDLLALSCLPVRQCGGGQYLFCLQPPNLSICTDLPSWLEVSQGAKPALQGLSNPARQANPPLVGPRRMGQGMLGLSLRPGAGHWGWQVWSGQVRLSHPGLWVWFPGSAPELTRRFQ